MSGFNNPIIGGGGALVYPSIHSPNFQHELSGWSINKDGSAEFNNLVIRNGQIISGSALYYSSTPPSKATLVASISAAATTDSFGNLVPAGLATYAASGGASFVVNLLSTNPSAFFQYNAPSGGVQGGHILIVAAANGTDPVTGIGYSAGMTGIDPVFADTINVIGATIKLNQPFNFTRPAQIGANAGGGATSPFIAVDAPEQGGIAPAHLQMKLQGTSPDGTHLGQLLIGQVAGGGSVTPVTSAMLEIQAQEAAPPDPPLVVISVAAGDRIFGSRVSGDADNRIRIDTSAPGGRIAIKTGAGTATQDSTLFNAAAALWASDPIAANISGAAETWHAVAFQNSWANSGSGVACQYRKTILNRVEIVGDLTVPVAGPNTVIFTLPAGYRPASTQQLELIVVSAAGGAAQFTTIRAFVAAAGNITAANFPAGLTACRVAFASGTSISLDA